MKKNFLRVFSKAQEYFYFFLNFIIKKFYIALLFFILFKITLYSYNQHLSNQIQKNLMLKEKISLLNTQNKVYIFEYINKMDKKNMKNISNDIPVINKVKRDSKKFFWRKKWDSNP